MATYDLSGPASGARRVVKSYGGQISQKSGHEALSGSVTTSLTGSNNDLTYTADEAGVEDVTVAYADPDASGESISVDVTGGDIVVNLATAADVAATLTTSLTGTNNDLVYTADTPGAAGNSITVAYVDPAGNDQSLDVDVTGSDIVVSLATGPGGAITSTATQVKAAIDGDTAAAALVNVANATGNNGSGIVTAMAETPLAGGVDGGAITSTASQVKAAIDGDTAAAALVDVELASGNTGAGVVTAMSETPLTGGEASSVSVSKGVSGRTRLPTPSRTRNVYR